MSNYTVTMATDKSTGCVRRIGFKCSMKDGDVSVSAMIPWDPEVQDRRPKDWTKDLIDVEYARCDAKHSITNLLRKRMAKRKARIGSGFDYDTKVSTIEE